ncbi:V/A-type H+-transporting ATPase subunit C [Hydrogenoanaerobacterium saccharovorans]|uniref:V/A-type H+-transporting ATPase subunit C n=1 Tax=Hydrogenoanaerobacterium saccharovorans TaxID=474960 RepID=A0A1H8DU32_9FIRM|nr:V-type ATPase subunit [Hydrogenoanaerobacterium saccharovorans]RPF42392.1 V/A-type H+-transporting ATPase subunit C [Hydrogenoanaerobacterium saccharovorans]SEN10720.1 V/A-type H+-transporting ATPase subunit C [Hydrogenoanaerobacterium saccharovorans]
MSEKQYTYAVARIRAKELSLLSSAAVEQLLAGKSYDECLHTLAEKGWGDDGTLTAEQLLENEREQTWALIAELVDDMSVFDVFLYANDYHNLKAAIKQVCTETEHKNIFISNGTVDSELILTAIKEHNYSMLPADMREPAQEAFEALLHTRDGQLCDMIVDKAALNAIYKAGLSAENELLKLYAELTVAAANIKTAVRCQKTGKSLDILQRALAQCSTLDVDRLAHAAVIGFDAICEYLESTTYTDAVAELRTSPSAFERWCDNLIIRKIRPQLYNPFTIGPLAAYILARENEIKTVRIILSGKLNGLSEESIRERCREMYV